jgi:RNase adapter protein RapZ
MALRRFVIVTGLSGAGKSQALKSFEDLGFYCLDNLPPTLLPGLLDLVRTVGRDRLAVALDVRTNGAFGSAPAVIESIIANGETPEILFLEARDETLIRRYSETRRKHPYAHVGHLADAIAAERTSLEPLLERAGEVWDTSGLTLTALMSRIAHTYAQGPAERRIQVAIIAFGYKHGLPLDADLVFDVRFLANPNYVAALHHQSGLDPEVQAYLEEQPRTAEALQRLCAFVDYVTPLYAGDSRSIVTIGIGCTGGRHRSVYVASKLAEHLAATNVDVTTVYRDIDR